MSGTLAVNILYDVLTEGVEVKVALRSSWLTVASSWLTEQEPGSLKFTISDIGYLDPASSYCITEFLLKLDLCDKNTI